MDLFEEKFIENLDRKMLDIFMHYATSLRHSMGTNTIGIFSQIIDELELNMDSTEKEILRKYGILKLYEDSLSEFKSCITDLYKEITSVYEENYYPESSNPILLEKDDNLDLFDEVIGKIGDKLDYIESIEDSNLNPFLISVDRIRTRLGIVYNRLHAEIDRAMDDERSAKNEYEKFMSSREQRRVEKNDNLKMTGLIIAFLSALAFPIGIAIKQLHTIREKLKKKKIIRKEYYLIINYNGFKQSRA